MTCLDARDALVVRRQLLPRGYAVLRSEKGKVSRRPVYAHRHVYEECFGAIPEKHEIHHTCGNPTCVNPEHFALTTRLSHMGLHRATHCKKGHELTPENTMFDPWRRCRKCRQEYLRRRYAPTVGAQLEDGP
jgi:hypothetical protein